MVAKANATTSSLNPLQKARLAQAQARDAWAGVSAEDVRAEIAGLLGTPQQKALFEELAMLLGALPEGDQVRGMLTGVIAGGLRIPQHIAEAQAAAAAKAG